MLAYVTRSRDAETQLLVFRNLDETDPGGFEVPGGGVDDGETPEAAVVRELHEESGIADARIVRKLHEYGWWNSYRGRVQQRHVFHLQGGGASPDEWTHTVEGTGGDHGKRFAYRWLDLRHAGVLAWDMGQSVRYLKPRAERSEAPGPPATAPDPGLRCAHPSASDVKIRPATASDLGAVTAILNHYIATSAAIYTDRPAEEMDLWQRLKNFDAKKHPLIVAAEQGNVVGYGSLSPVDAKVGYRHTVEDSVYVHPDHRGRGLGPALLAELLKLADAAGHHVVLARIDTDQPASIALHQRAGFEHVGTLPEVGRKFDTWRDASFWVRRS